MEPKKIHAIDEKKIRALDDKSSLIKKEIKNNSISFVSEKSQKNPHKVKYSTLTAIARILSISEVCGCVYLKDGEILISTNKSEKESKNELKDKKGKKRNVSNVRDEIGEIIHFLLKDVNSKNSDKEKIEKKTNLYKKVNSIKISSLQFAPSLYSSRKEEETFQICQTAFNLKNELRNIEKESLDKKIPNLKSKLDEYWKSGSCEGIDQKLKKNICLLLTYLSDLEDILKLIDEKSDNPIKKYILKKGENWAERYSSVKDLHAEMAAIERENDKCEMSLVVKNIVPSIEKGNFAVSKILCLVCMSFFESLLEVHEKEKDSKKTNFKNKDSLESLGGSMILFPNWKSPSIRKEDDFNIKLIEALSKKIDLIKEKIGPVEKEDYFIENSPYYSQFALDENTKYNYIEH